MILLTDCHTVEEGQLKLRWLDEKINGGHLFQKPMSMAPECIYFPYIISNKKKQYIAIMHKKGENPSILIKGLGSERRENCMVTRRALRDLIAYMLNETPPPEALADRAAFHVQRLIGCQPEDHICGGRGSEPSPTWDEKEERFVEWDPDSRETWCAPLREFELSNQLGKRLESYARYTYPHVETAYRWRTHDPATAPREGDRVPYFFVFIAADAKGKRTHEKVSARARAPYEIAGLCTTGTEVLDREFYFARKFQTPMKSLLRMFNVDEALISKAFDLSRYTFIRLMQGDVQVRTIRVDDGSAPWPGVWQTERTAKAIPRLQRGKHVVDVLGMLTPAVAGGAPAAAAAAAAGEPPSHPRVEEPRAPSPPGDVASSIR